MKCDECTNSFEESEGKYYKYEPSRWHCDDCDSHLMEDDEVGEEE